MGALTPEMINSLKESNGLIGEYPYYRPTDKKDLE